MNFRVSGIGQFADVSVDFGDLTLLVGAQGTGKSIFLHLFKLSLDQEYVKNTMNQFGQDWSKKSKPGLMEARSPTNTPSARVAPRYMTQFAPIVTPRPMTKGGSSRTSPVVADRDAFAGRLPKMAPSIILQPSPMRTPSLMTTL